MLSSVELQFVLSPLQRIAVTRWVETFRCHEENWAQSPAVDGSGLRVTAMALPFLLGYADPADGELTARYLRREGERRIRQALAQAPSVKTARYFFRALENLGEIAPGEFRAGVA